MIGKLSSGKFRLYSKKKDTKTGKRSNLGTFGSRQAAQKHERAGAVLQTSWLSAAQRPRLTP